MPRKHKRPRTASSLEEQPSKRTRNDKEDVTIKHPTLCIYYTRTLTLRDYLLSKLPTNSKIRRRKVATSENVDLNRILVCQVDSAEPESDLSLIEDFQAFSQKINASAIGSTGCQSACQSDLINFAIWHLFHRIHRHIHRPPHMLCHGYQRANDSTKSHEDHGALGGIPGIVSHYPNESVNTMKSASWIEVHKLLGHGGDRIMLDLLLYYGLYTEVDGGRANYSQISGAEP